MAGGLLGALLFALVLTSVSNRIFAHGMHAKPTHSVVVLEKSPVDVNASAPAPVVAEATPAASEPAAAVSESRSVVASEPAAMLTAPEKKADAEEKGCASCDAVEKSVVAKAGPPLFAIVDRPKNSVAGLAHSNSLRAQEASWTVNELDQYLASPHGGAQASEAEAAKRADMIDYLRRLADHPQRGRSK